jgi:hypothetical protein
VKTTLAIGWGLQFNAHQKSPFNRISGDYETVILYGNRTSPLATFYFRKKAEMYLFGLSPGLPVVQRLPMNGHVAGQNSLD